MKSTLFVDLLAQLESTSSRFERLMQSLATKTEVNIMKTDTNAKFDNMKGDITNLKTDFSKQSDGINICFNTQMKLVKMKRFFFSVASKKDLIDTKSRLDNVNSEVVNTNIKIDRMKTELMNTKPDIKEKLDCKLLYSIVNT